MRKLITITVVLALLAGIAAGDIVYMRDGRQLVGKVVKKPDGTMMLEMAMGTITLNEKEILYIAYGSGGKPTSAPVTVLDNKPKPVAVRPEVVWDISKANLPEPLVFMLYRRAEALADVAASASLRQQVARWRITAHDARRRLANEWLTRDDQRRRRALYESRLRKAGEYIKKAAAAERALDESEKTKANEHLAKARTEMRLGIRAWPDTIMQNFLYGALDLDLEDYKNAEQRFRKCVQDEPLVAAFRQGRGLALMGAKRPVEALAEFIACFELADDQQEAYRLVVEAMKAVPGAKVKEAIYRKARDLIDRYEEPKANRYGSSGSFHRARGRSWLMPGKKPWQSRDANLLPLPTYDRIVTRQGLAVPIAENALMVDSATIEKSSAIYVQLEPGLLVGAIAQRKSGYSSWSRKKKVDLPVSAIVVPTATFTAVDVKNVPPLTNDGYVTVRSVNAFRQMGTGIRTGTARVIKGDDGKLSLSGAALAGETAGAVFVEDAFAGIFSGRLDAQAEDCGASQLVSPADLVAGVEALTGSMRSFRRYSYSRGPTLKEDAPKHVATGPAFVVYAVIGETAPPPLLK